MAKMAYPETRRSDHTDTYHGTVVADPYRWLEDLNAPETRAWIGAQNTLTFNYLDNLPQSAALQRRLTELWDYPKIHAPFRRGDRYFQFRNTGLQNQDVLYVMETPDGVPTGGDRVLVDPNTLSEDGTTALTGLAVSKDGRWLAYATSASGSDWKTWHVRDIETGADLPDEIVWSKFTNATWMPDNKSFLYGRYAAPAAGSEYAETNYNQRLYLHRLNTPQSDDVLIYERPDHPTWSFDAVVTDDGSYLVLHVGEGTDRRNRVFYRRLEGKTPDAGEAFTELIPDLEAAYEFLGNTGTTFYFRTNLDAPKGRIIAIDVAHPARDRWETLVPEGEDTLEEAIVAYDAFVTLYLHDAHHRLRRFDLTGADLGTIELPTLGALDSLHGRREHDELFFTFSSFTYPPTVYRYDCKSGTRTCIAQAKVDFNPDDYVTDQVFATSSDGTKVPLFVVHRRDWTKDGHNPTLLYGYGGFNIPITPGFQVERLVWLEMGGVLAVANLRGGGEYGEAWHQAGMIHNKQNVFDDFIACANYLIDTDITSTPKLAIEGRSNGGLLVGACLTQRPDLFGAALPTVGVMDMLRFHKFTIGWAWVSDYGSADDPEEFETLYDYSPVHNVRPADYPPTLILTGDHDDRVMPAHSYKFAAALQATQQGDAPILIRIQTKTGHGAGKPTQLLIEERADMWAFLANALSMDVDRGL
jgi:prolyl oligopeptidase